MHRSDAGAPKGRGAGFNPSNRFESTHRELELEQVEEDEEYLAALGRPPTEYLPDRSRTIIATNDSPDVGFDASINPYRGCEHGCIYCYARPTHEFLGYSAGLDFETKILVKEDAAGAAARGVVVAPVEAAGPGAERRDRPVPAAGTAARAHPALPDGAGRVPPGCRHHHQEPACDPRHRPAGRAGAAWRRRGVRIDHDARPGADGPAGAADVAADGAAGGDRRAQSCGHPGRSDGRADHPWPE